MHLMIHKIYMIFLIDYTLDKHDFLKPLA